MVKLAGRLVGKEVIVSDGKSLQHRCVIEMVVGSSQPVQMCKKHRQPPAFQVRSKETNKIIACFSEEIARILSSGEALSMKLA